MTISFELPAEIEQELRREFPNLEQLIKEAALVELYRQEQLTHHMLAKSLGISRFEADGVLKLHNVTEDLITLEEYDEQMAAMRKLLGD